MEWLSQNVGWVILAIGVWFIFAWRGGHGFGRAGGHSHGGSHQGGHGDHREDSSAGKAIDPVSGKSIDSTHAITAYYGGRVYFFENEDNRRRFEVAPADFAAKGTGVEPSSQGQRAHRHHGC